jgi:phosphotransferase system enzyme I (PtsI)
VSGELLRGIGASGGVAVGQVYLLHPEPLPVVPDPLPPERVEDEIERFHAARQAAGRELESLTRQVQEALGERYVGILEAQRLVLEDPILVTATTQRIRVGRVSARWALKEAVAELVRRFDTIDDEYLRERGGELADVQRRLQRLLRGEQPHDPRVPDQAIVVAHAVGPSDAILLASQPIVGLATDVGGRTSHTAILAQALCIPAVLGLHDLSQRVRAGDPLLLDGDAGTVVLAPSAAQVAEAETRRAASRELETRQLSDRDLPAVTLDGVEIVIRANIEFPTEVERALRFRARGIGLYRSEFLFTSRTPELPDAEEHYRIYREIAERVAPEPAIVRTLDLGGEKYFHEVLGGRSGPPVLGLRGVRFSLERPEIFRPQLAGLLRAAAEQDNLRMLLPLVSTIDEVRAVRRLLAEEAQRLAASGRAVRPDLPLGIMIEVPAAAMAADLFAQEIDFLSIGTNDLIQYAIAVDRGNEDLTALYQPFHPGVLRMLKFVVDSGRRHGIPVALCGEMAADPNAVPLLVGLGLRELSVQPRAVGLVRHAVRHTDAGQAERLARHALERPSAAEILRFMSSD